MRSFTGALVAAAAALAASGSALAAPESLSDFRLPPERSDSQPSPDRQGPVAPDVAESQVRPTPTPTPVSPRAESSPDVVVPPITIAPAPEPPDGLSPPEADGWAQTDDAIQSPSAPSEEVTAIVAPPVPEPTSARSATSPPQPPTPIAEPAGPAWPWTALGLLGIALVGFGVWVFRRRRASGGALSAQPVERPRLGNANDHGAPAQPAAVSGEPLRVALEPLRLSLTLMNATLSYRLELANRSPAAITNLDIEADMISAHASLSREEHLSGPANGAGSLRRIARIEPGASEVIEGEFRLPLSGIVPIRQGNAALLLPLARFRLRGGDGGTTVRTYVVGQPGARQDGRMEPFRLDLGPRIYPRLAQRAFA